MVGLIHIMTPTQKLVFLLEVGLKIMERRHLQSKEFLEQRSARADRVNQKREFLAWQEDVIREAKHKAWQEDVIREAKHKAWQEDVIREAKHKAWLTHLAKAHEQDLIRFNELKSAKILDNNALQEM